LKVSKDGTTDDVSTFNSKNKKVPTDIGGQTELRYVQGNE